MVFSIFLVLCSFTGLAQAEEAFMFSCKDTAVKTYWYLTDVNGQIKSDGWENGKYNSTWKITYLGDGNKIDIDGKKGVVFFVNNTAIAVVYQNHRGLSQNVLSYGISLKSNKVAAATVNMHNVIGSGTKVRAVDLTCSRLQ